MGLPQSGGKLPPTKQRICPKRGVKSLGQVWRTKGEGQELSLGVEGEVPRPASSAQWTMTPQVTHPPLSVGAHAKGAAPHPFLLVPFLILTVLPGAGLSFGGAPPAHALPYKQPEELHK